MRVVKSSHATIKAATGESDEGIFEAIVATYDLDSYGDKIIPGAFADTLAEWKASGNPIPVLWAHQNSDLDSHIGIVLEAEERKEGLWVKAQLDQDDLKDPRSQAHRVYKLMKGRRLTQFSFQFEVLDGGFVEQKSDGRDESYYELRKIKLFEVGPCLVGVNQNTSLVSVKAHQDSKTSGSASRGADPVQQDLTEVLLRIHEELAEIKSRLNSAHTSEVQATPTPHTETQSEPPQVKAVDLDARSGTASSSLRAQIEWAKLEMDALIDLED